MHASSTQVACKQVLLQLTVYSIAIGATWDTSLILFSSTELSKIIPYFIIKTFILIMFPDFLLTLAEV